MTGSSSIELTLLPGAQALLGVHARELPQRDDLCGAFCGALALNAAGIVERGGEPVDQDAVAVRAGSIVSGIRDPATMPGGEGGRRDYRLELAKIDDPEISGTTAGGVVRAIDQIGGGAVVAIPLAGPWSAAALDAFFELACACDAPVSLLANLATHHLWGAGASTSEILAELLQGDIEGPPADWAVGHFVCIVARLRGPAGTLYAVADTYPSLGRDGVHLQPRERLARAIARVDKPAGGVIVVAQAQDAPRLRDGARALGLQERIWDNGTPERVEAA